jgi:hypothetical protein
MCAMQSTTSSATATLNSLFGVVGLVSAPTRESPHVPTASHGRLEASIAPQRPAPPDPPPPRA